MKIVALVTMDHGVGAVEFKIENDKIKNNQAYTLVELSISLTIIAILLTIFLGVIGFQREKERYNETYKKIDKIEKAIVNFFNQNGYIPCPAPSNSLESNSAFGNSINVYDITSNTCTNGLSNFSGMVPVRTLMISDDNAYDGWNRKFTFRVGQGLGNASTFPSSIYRGEIRVTNLLGNEVTSINEIPPNNYGAAYILISFGPNGSNAGWGRNSTVAPSGATGPEAQNTNPNSLIYIQNVKTNNFDDILVFKQKNQFIINKKGVSPTLVPLLTCANAKAINDMTISSTSLISAGLASQISLSANALSTLCDNPPVTCRFLPNMIAGSNLQIWLDGNDPAGNNTPPALGSLISTLINKANSLNNAVQGSSNLQPIYNSNNNFIKNGINYSTTNQTLQISLGDLNNSDYTIFFAGMISDGAILGSVDNSTNGGNNNKILIGYFANPTTASSYNLGANNLSLYFGQGNNDLALNINSNDFINVPFVSQFMLDSISGTLTTGHTINYYNNNNLSLFSKKDNAIVRPILSSTSGGVTNSSIADLKLGPSGFFGELLAYNRALNNYERSQVIEYLINRWFTNVCN